MSKLLLSILAVICPPLAVAVLKEAEVEAFFLCLILTLLAYVPGLLYALYCIWR